MHKRVKDPRARRGRVSRPRDGRFRTVRRAYRQPPRLAAEECLSRGDTPGPGVSSRGGWRDYLAQRWARRQR